VRDHQPRDPRTAKTGEHVLPTAHGAGRAEAGVELLSTGGTARVLRDAGLQVKDISDHTGFPEMLDGRVKTLHPRVHGGLLYLRGNPEHEQTVRDHDIAPIDLVVVNLYPFEATVARDDCTLDMAVESRASSIWAT
jgi:phosphoribosylaminoimidazolecarboxamide formyltransferase/IMP cyclohydrolase